MSDMTHFSDDISSLWGPGGGNAVDPKPAPLVRTSQRPPEPEPPAAALPPAVDPHRLAALEERISGLSESLEAHRSALDAALADQEARVLAGTAAATEARFAVLEGQLARRLQEMGEQVSAMIASAATAAAAAAAHGPQALPAIGPEADRVDALERQLHEGVTSVHRAVNAMRARAVGNVDLDALEGRMKADLERVARSVEARDAQFLQRAEMKTLWDAMKASLDASLTQVRADAMAAATADLAAVRADIGDRLARVEETLMMLRQATPNRSR